MYCPNCGREIPDGSKFCPYCGAKIDVGTKKTSNRSPFLTKPTNIILIIVIIVSLIGVFALVWRKGGIGSGMAGKYINIGDKSDIMVLNRNKTFYIEDEGIKYTGKYKISGNKIIFELTVLGTPMTQECTIVKNGFNCDFGEGQIDKYKKEGHP